MIPLIKGMAAAYGGPGAIEPLWWCLSLGACLGGNGTLIGASANLDRRRHRRAQRHPLRLYSISRLRRADDARVHRHLPALCVAALFFVRARL